MNQGKDKGKRHGTSGAGRHRDGRSLAPGGERFSDIRDGP